MMRGNFAYYFVSLFNIFLITPCSLNIFFHLFHFFYLLTFRNFFQIFYFPSIPVKFHQKNQHAPDQNSFFLQNLSWMLFDLFLLFLFFSLGTNLIQQTQGILVLLLIPFYPFDLFHIYLCHFLYYWKTGLSWKKVFSCGFRLSNHISSTLSFFASCLMTSKLSWSKIHPMHYHWFRRLEQPIAESFAASAADLCLSLVFPWITCYQA